MFTIAQLIKEHLDRWCLWPLRVISRSYTNVKLDDIHGVVSMSRKRKWPVSSCRLLLCPRCIDTNVYHHTVNKSASWPLTLTDLYESLQDHTQIWHWMTFTGLFQGHESEQRIWRLPESSRLPSDTYFNSMTIDLLLDWFGAMSRPSQQQLGFLF